MKLNETTHRLSQTIERIDGAYAPATIRAYKADFIDFIEFCESNNTNALPASAEIIASYITHLTNANRSSASIRRAVSGIATIHTLNEYFFYIWNIRSTIPFAFKIRRTFSFSDLFPA